MNTSKIVLGTVQFGTNYGINNVTGQVPFEEVCKILQLAYDNGIRTLDTSAAYGVSEQVLGRALKETKLQFKIVSKYPQSKEHVSNIFQQSIHNLGVDFLYGYLIHHFDFYLKNPHIYDEMKQLKEKEKIKKIGFSIYTIDQLNYLMDHHIQFDILQFPYNIFDRQFETYMKFLDEQSVEIHTRSAFLQGLFFKDTNHLPAKLLPLRPDLETLHAFCNTQNIKTEDLALGYVLANPFVKGALIGVDNHQQLKKNLLVASHRISEEELHFIQTINVQAKDLLNPVNWN